MTVGIVGLGLIGGDIAPIAPDVTEGLKIPHIGWNALSFPKDKEKSKIYNHYDVITTPKYSAVVDESWRLNKKAYLDLYEDGTDESRL